VLDQRVARRRPNTPAPIMVTGLELASVGGVQSGTLAPSGTGWRGGGLVGEVEKARICCLGRN
jgi:hypothetical protein